MTLRADGKELPTTTYAVLGLVSFGETSGYDLKRFADHSIRYFFWSPASSQVYAELRRLAALGYVTEREVPQERRPNKRLYKITPEGEEALRRWLSLGVEPDVLKSSFLLKLFFGQLTPQATLIAQLEERRSQLEQALGEFRAIEQRIAGDQSYFFPYLTLKSGIAHSVAALQWVEEALQDLEDRHPGSQDDAGEARTGWAQPKV